MKYSRNTFDRWFLDLNQIRSIEPCMGSREFGIEKTKTKDCLEKVDLKHVKKLAKGT